MSFRCLFISLQYSTLSALLRGCLLLMNHYPLLFCYEIFLMIMKCPLGTNFRGNYVLRCFTVYLLMITCVKGICVT